MITVLETWRIVNKWWTEQPDERLFAEVRWYGKKFVFAKRPDEKIWRIYK